MMKGETLGCSGRGRLRLGLARSLGAEAAVAAASSRCRFASLCRSLSLCGRASFGSLPEPRNPSDVCFMRLKSQSGQAVPTKQDRGKHQSRTTRQ